MAHSVRITFQSDLPGTGFNNTGTAVNKKRLAIGQVHCTNVTSGLESVTEAELGFTTIDFIKVNVRSASGADAVPAKTATTSVHADWDDVNKRLVISDIAAAGDRTAITNGEDPIVEFLAFGDSTVPELT